MAQRQFRSDDTASWLYGFGDSSDGTKTVSSNSDYDGANAGCSGTAAGATLTIDAASTFADGDLILIHQSRGTGVGTWELNKIASGGGTTTLTLTHALINTYTDSGASQAQVIELKQYSAVTVNGSVTWSAPAWDGSKGGIIAFLCSGTTTITGAINLDGLAGATTTDLSAGGAGDGYIGGVGDKNGSGGNGTAFSGEGTVGATTNSTSANGTGGGGGATTGSSQTFGGAGAGGGGHAAAGTAGTASTDGSAGAAGGTGGTADLVTMIFGGAGGGGHTKDANGGLTSGGGGAAAGIVVVITKDLTIGGNIFIRGGAGGASTARGPGGGGSGGSCLLKFQTGVLGTNLIVGTGGTGATGGQGGVGGNGSVGRIHADYKTSISGSTNPAIDSRQDATIDYPSSGGGVDTSYSYFM